MSSPFDNIKTMTALQAGTHKETGQPTRIEVFDADPRYEGLAVRVSPPGPKSRTSLKSFTFTYGWAGKRVRLTMGQFPALGIAAARNKALGFKSMLALDPPQDPRTVASVRPADVQERPETVADLVRFFVDAKRAAPNCPRTIDNIERLLTVDVAKIIGAVRLAELTKADVNKPIDVKRNAGKHQAARSVHRYQSSMLNWATNEKGWLAVNPMAGMSLPDIDPEDTYALTGDEVATLWRGLEKALPKDHPEYARLLRFCLATGCRLNEAAELDLKKEWTRPDGTTFTEIDRITGKWILPKERSKNKRENHSPLSSLALELLGNEPRFPWNGTGTINPQAVANAFSNGDAAKRMGIDERATIHALRRTVSTQVVENLKAPDGSKFGWHIGEAILHHVPTGTTARYIKSTFYEERRDALNAWADRIRTLVEK